MQHLNALLTILDNERKLILGGDLHALPELAQAKANALSQLKLQPLTQDQLATLQSTSARNQSLLSAAANGIRAAQKRLEALRNPDQGVKTYTRTGAAETISRPVSNFEKRA